MDVTPDTRDTILRLLRGYENLNLMGNPIFAEHAPLPVRRGADDLRPLGRAGRPLHGTSPRLHNLFIRVRKEYQTARFRRDQPENPPGNLAFPGIQDLSGKSHAISISPPAISAAAVTCLNRTKKTAWATHFPACGGCLWAQGIIQCP
ncbi:MAG: hypothetical protein MZV63_26030 [Marinilabiliales bacterium]|nr:hypothetical protein [Marinilabiliales bacterium]